MDHFGRSEFQAAADAIRAKSQQKPRIGMMPNEKKRSIRAGRAPPG